MIKLRILTMLTKAFPLVLCPDQAPTQENLSSRFGVRKGVKVCKVSGRFSLELALESRQGVMGKS